MARLWRVLSLSFARCVMVSMVRHMQNPCAVHDFMILSVKKIIKKCKHLTIQTKFPCLFGMGFKICIKKADFICPLFVNSVNFNHLSYVACRQLQNVKLVVCRFSLRLALLIQQGFEDCCVFAGE